MSPSDDARPRSTRTSLRGSREAATGSPPTVLLEDVHKSYANGRVRVAALRGISLEITRGEAVAIVGRSGCGKSTLLNLISAVDRPDAGRVIVCGHELSTAREADLTLLRRREIGVVFQSFHLLPNLTAAENVALPLALDGHKDPERVRDLLERVGLGERLLHYPAELSGGEEQRVALARALIHRPSLVVADEPTGNLDSKSGAAVLGLLDELRLEEGFALAVATHDAQVAARADRVVTISDGRVAQVPAR